MKRQQRRAACHQPPIVHPGCEHIAVLGGVRVTSEWISYLFIWLSVQWCQWPVAVLNVRPRAFSRSALFYMMLNFICSLAHSLVIFDPNAHNWINQPLQWSFSSSWNTQFLSECDRRAEVTFNALLSFSIYLIYRIIFICYHNFHA